MASEGSEGARSGKNRKVLGLVLHLLVWSTSIPNLRKVCAGIWAIKSSLRMIRRSWRKGYTQLQNFFEMAYIDLIIIISSLHQPLTYSRTPPRVLQIHL